MSYVDVPSSSRHILIRRASGLPWPGGVHVPVNTVLPAITGTAAEGQTLTSGTGTWNNVPTSYAYQWKRGAVNIGTNSNTYTVVAGDVGGMISCVVTAINAGGSASATSAAVGPVVGVPLLTAVSAVDFSDVFVWLQATTDTANGTYYAAVCPSAASAPTAAQVKAGTDGSGAAATSTGNLAISSTGVKRILLRGLTAVTAYKIYLTHETTVGFSLVSNASFTTDTLVIAFATNGLSTGLAGSTGCGAIGTNIADPHGGTNAVRFVDNNSLTSNQCLVNCTGITFYNGVNKFHITTKHQGGAAWFRQIPGSVTVVPSAWYNTSTGALGTVNAAWTPTPVVYDVGSGWRMFSGQVNMAGADVAGTWGFNKGAADNNLVIPSLDGTHIQDIYNFRITRV